MNFYTNVYQKGDRIYLRGYKNGKQVEEIIKYPGADKSRNNAKNQAIQ